MSILLLYESFRFSTLVILQGDADLLSEKAFKQ